LISCDGWNRKNLGGFLVCNGRDEELQDGRMASGG
jgi:hypothetical protein